MDISTYSSMYHTYLLCSYVAIMFRNKMCQDSSVDYRRKEVTVATICISFLPSIILSTRQTRCR